MPGRPQRKLKFLIFPIWYLVFQIIEITARQDGVCLQLAGGIIGRRIVV
jgi:hypothetical protein